MQEIGLGRSGLCHEGVAIWGSMDRPVSQGECVPVEATPTRQVRRGTVAIVDITLSVATARPQIIPIR
jgi:hypothetical protein